MKTDLMPDLTAKRLYDVDVEALAARGVRVLLLDLDNTLTKWKVNIVDDATRLWVARAAARGLTMCIVSNSNGTRAGIVAGMLGIEYMKNAAKPFPGGIRRAMRQMGSDERDTAMIGDQLYTDILGGKRAGIFTVLVRPIDRKEFIWTQFVRIFEHRKLKRLGLR